ncbi:MAG: protein kinase [Acidobacteria bacterium]|nr:protein kinase [Acidobacteriota bacterium]
MTPERWQAIDELFQAALALAPAERDAFLDQRCAQDLVLRREVESLLRFQSETDDFLEARPSALAADLMAAQSALAVPQQVGAYEVLSELGRGGMGAVYLARDARLGRQVALKLLPPATVADAESVRRFRQEARAVSALNHPNILTLFELGESDEQQTTHFIATEYVEGQTLRSLLKQGSLTLGEALDVAAQTASALAAAHEAGIIHRDIKPENLMRRPDGLVKVLDFGIAKLTRRKTAAGNASFLTVNTNPGLIMGTVSYMSPEQARGLDVDSRSDLFSLGVVLYEMLTAHAPFAGATTSDVLASILEREPPPLKSYAPALPAELQRIVSRALAKERDERYQHANELLAELKELKQELELAARLKRSGDTPVGQVSLSLRVGQTAPGSAANTDDAPTTVTNAVTKPAALRRFVRPPILVILAATALLIVLALYRYWPQGSREEIRAIAVLPFVNASNDSEIEYLTDGITDNLMQSLQQMSGLRVMARGTINTYKGRVVDPRQVGQELKVQAVITGRIQRQGNRLVVSADMAETRDGTLLWDDRYQRSLDDLSALQDQLAREIALKLRPQLAQTATPQTSTTPAIKSEAYQLYLKGRYFQRQATQVGGEKALELFNQAIRLEPKFALPHSGIALVYQNLSSQSVPPREARERARQAALTALALNNQLAEAHYALATVKVLDWDSAGAEQEFKQAINLNPDYIDARYSYGGTLARLHRYAEAQAELERAAETDPLSQQVCQGLGNIYFYSHQVGRAREQFRKTIELDSKGTWASAAHRALAMILLEEKHSAEALEEFRLALAASPTDTTKSWLAYGYTRVGKEQEARAILRELQAAAKQHWVSPVYLARIHIGLSEYDQAIARLRESYAAQSDHLTNLSVDNVYDPIRNDPRFLEILRGVGLPQ